MKAFTLSILMLVAGMGIPVMAALNADLGLRLNSPMAAVFILSIVAMVVSGLMLLVGPGFQEWRLIQSVPKVLLCAGALFIFYILSITVSAPKIGLGTAVFLVLMGQVLAASAIDHFGMFNLPVIEFSPLKIVGIFVMIVGFVLLRKESFGW